jgi:hypothetical protein
MLPTRREKQSMIDLDELFGTPPTPTTVRVAARTAPAPAAIVPVKSATHTPPPAVRTCNHADPKLYVDVGADARGWIETQCRECGGFIGYRPPK